MVITNRIIINWAFSMLLLVSTYVPAGEAVSVSNCMRHLGGGGYGDFNCYESNAVVLEANIKKTMNNISSTKGLSSKDKVELNRYMSTQDEAVQACNMAITFSYAWGIDSPPKTHRNYYDVISARCHYFIRKQQNNFLIDLYSIYTG